MRRTRSGMLAVALAAAVLSGCVPLPVPPPPPVQGPSVVTVPATSDPVPSPAPTSAGAGTAEIDCAVEPSPDVDEDGTEVVGQCVDVTIRASGVSVAEAESVSVLDGEGIWIGAAGSVTINGFEIVVEVGDVDEVVANGVGCTLSADAVSTSLDVNGADHLVEWSTGIAASAASENGVDNVLVGP